MTTFADADADALQIRIQSGLDLLPRGKALAEHVAAQMAGTDLTAEKIAALVGYRVDRCARRLAEAGHAPLARMLLERHYRDAYRPKPTPNRGWVPATKYVRRKPGPVPVNGDDLDDLMTDLLELADVGLSFADAARIWVGGRIRWRAGCGVGAGSVRP